MRVRDGRGLAAMGTCRSCVALRCPMPHSVPSDMRAMRQHAVPRAACRSPADAWAACGRHVSRVVSDTERLHRGFTGQFLAAVDDAIARQELRTRAYDAMGNPL